MSTRNRTGRRVVMLVIAMAGFLAGVVQPAAAETTAACAIQPYGAIGDKWRSIGGESSFYGCATMAEAPTGDGRNGRFQYFHGGLIIWHPSTGAHLVYGAIHDAFVAAGREAAIGYPLNDEYGWGSPGCRRQDFEWYYIYWCP